MRKFHAIIFLFFSIVAFSGAGAQSFYTASEIGIALGGSQYFGDLNDSYGFKTISPAGGIYLRRRMTSYIAIKIVANYTKVGYNDNLNSNIYEQERNLNFESIIIETALQAEFNFFKFITGDPERRFTPFLTGGIGAFYYNPYTNYNGSRYYLRPLGTEGQNAHYGGRNYSNIAACLPIGAGIKCWVKGGVNLTLEVADRLTNTDYLDDVSNTYVGINNFPQNSVAAALQNRTPSSDNSTLGEAGKQRGNTASKDQYMLALLSISWNFTTYRCPRLMSEDLIRVRSK